MVALQQSEDQESLLTIGQAAEMLQVSQISLRRWTDSGHLKCYRVGARRERRFRREDLLAFMDDAYQIPRNKNDVKPKKNEDVKSCSRAVISLEGVTIEYSKHLCSLYESDLGRLKMSVPFLADGLRGGDICYVVGSETVNNEIVTGLKRVYEDIENCLKKGLLILSNGEDSADAMYGYFERELVSATQSGRHSVRVLGDMSWFLDKGMGLDDLNQFEMLYNNHLAHRFPVISLCQYDARRFDGSGILCALRCHEDTFSYPLSRFIGI